MGKHSSLSSDTTISGSGTWADGITTGNIRRYTATLSQQLIDATSKVDAGFEYPIYGVKSCEGVLEMLADTTKSLDGPTGSHNFNPGTSGATLTLILYDTSTDHNISGTALLSRIEVSGIEFGAQADVPVFAYSFKFQGAFTVQKPA